MSDNSKGFAHILLIAVIAILLIVPVSLITLQSIQTSSGPHSAVLHDSTESDSSGGSGSSDSGSSSDDNSGSSSDDSGSSSDSTETHTEDVVSDDSSSESQMEVHDDGQVETQFESESGDGSSVKLHNQGDDSRLEIKLSETQRVRVRTKNGEERIDLRQGGVKVRFEYKDGKLMVKTETKGQPEGAEVEESDVAKIVDDLEKNDIQISTESGRIALKRGNASAVTDFPLSVDVDKNNLIVNTPAGERIVAVLPDQAIARMIATNTISDVSNKDNIELSEVDSEPVYELDGISAQKLLGLIPVSISKKIAVSAQTGNAVNVSQSFISKLLDALSF